jgi:hypothetical protein
METFLKAIFPRFRAHETIIDKELLIFGLRTQANTSRRRRASLEAEATHQINESALLRNLSSRWKFSLSFSYQHIELIIEGANL